MVFLLWACTFSFIYMLITGIKANGFTYESRIYIVYSKFFEIIFVSEYFSIISRKNTINLDILIFL